MLLQKAARPTELLFFCPSIATNHLVTVNKPTPAIVSQSAVRRLPLYALLLMCLAYVMAGFVGRNAWKTEDIATLGYIADLAQGQAAWNSPSALGSTTDSLAFLPYWLGAGMLLLEPWGVAADFAVRIPYMLLLVIAMVATWYGTYYLARSPKAQPVAFAFGGEAKPKDYARALADGGLLAFISCLGLAQLSHETTPALAQLSFSALYFFAIAALPYRRNLSLAAAIIAQFGLTLSGAPALALLFGLGSAVIHYLDRSASASLTNHNTQHKLQILTLVISTLVAALLAASLNLWRWKVVSPNSISNELNDFSQLILWFTWPAWPMALWTLWKWRSHLFTRNISRHLAWPSFIVGVILLATWATDSSDRTLLLALPALAPLAAFALPTIRGQVSALIDWFTLLFFTGCGIIIWVVWFAMLTGIPPQPATNVMRLAPGFNYTVSIMAFLLALVASAAWAYLVRWRVGRHRSVIWKSLALPAGGATLCWVLLMTLWLPLLDYTQSYQPLIKQVKEIVNTTECIQTHQLPQDIEAALRWYGKYDLQKESENSDCKWMLARSEPHHIAPMNISPQRWQSIQWVKHPADSKKSLWILRRNSL